MNNFTRSEFACKCGCGGNTIDFELAEVLQKLRDHFEAPVKVTSGFRCPAHNARVGGRPNSMHLTGKAADFSVKGIDPVEVCKYLEENYGQRYGIGCYRTFTHLDVRGYRARWWGYAVPNND